MDFTFRNSGILGLIGLILIFGIGGIILGQNDAIGALIVLTGVVFIIASIFVLLAAKPMSSTTSVSKNEWFLHYGKKTAIGLVVIGIGTVLVSNAEYLLIRTNWEFDLIGYLIIIIGLFTVIVSLLSILTGYSNSTPPNTYMQFEENSRKSVFFWILMVIADFAALFLLFKIGPSLGGLGILLILIGLLLILPLLSIMMGASAQLNAIRRIRNTIVSMGYTDNEAEKITMDVVRFLKASGTSLTRSGAGPLVPSWTEISGVELSTVINNVLDMRKVS